MRLRLLAGALLLGASTAVAQTITGRVTDRTSGFAVAGVVISAIDASGQAIARTVSDSATGYRFPVLPGMVRLQFRRIGYSPAEAAVADTVNGRLDVVLSRLPTVLPPVQAVLSAQCDARSDRGDALALWEEARSGFLASMVARQASQGTISVLAYRNGFQGDDMLARAVERVELPSASSAFSSGGEPDSLAKNGYRARAGFMYEFLGPDDRVLLDDSFLATHCFSIEPATDSTIGLRFEPAKGRKVVDIEGTVEIRKEPLELKSVTYRYVNVGGLQRANPGGNIQFERMPNGVTMINQWSIRGASAVGQISSGPTRARAGVVRPGARIGTGTTRYRDAVVEVSETGALIEVMMLPGTPTYFAALAVLSGVVVDKYTKRPLANTPLRLYRTPFAATTDSTGAFTILNVLPGLYEVDVGDFELEAYGAAPDLIGPIAIRYGENTHQLDAEGPEAAAVRGCAEKMDGLVRVPKAIGGPHAVFGQLALDNGRLPGEWGFKVELTPAGATPGSSAFPLKGKTDKLGRFRLCDLPPGTVRIVTDTKSGMSGAVDLTIAANTPYRLTTIKVAKK